MACQLNPSVPGGKIYPQNLHVCIELVDQPFLAKSFVVEGGKVLDLVEPQGAQVN